MKIDVFGVGLKHRGEGGYARIALGEHRSRSGGSRAFAIWEMGRTLVAARAPRCL
jgi:hypothetical protein